MVTLKALQHQILKQGEKAAQPQQKASQAKTIAELNQSFLKAAQANQVDRCFELLNHKEKSQRADINAQEATNGWSALHYACQNKNIKFVRVLIINESNVDAVDHNFVTPMMVACAQ